MAMFKTIPIFIKTLLFVFFINLMVMAYNSFSQELKNKADSASGEKLFKNNCSGCHLNGTNLIKPDKPIIGSLKIKSQANFGAFLENPPPPMPKFANITTKPETLNALYSYVVSLMGK